MFKHMKKVFFLFALIVALAMGVVFMSAFEAHVVNVTATIDNALNVTPAEIIFGTAFPQEQLQKDFKISLSQSFLDQNRVEDVSYIIKKKSKPRHNVISFPGGVSGHEYCLNNQPSDPGNPNDPYYTYCYPNLCDRLYLSPKNSTTTDDLLNEDGLSGGGGGGAGIPSPLNYTFGNLNSASSTLDEWNIYLRVPCFRGQCDQAYDPLFYGQPLDPRLEHQTFGCDLWVEVNGIGITTEKDLYFFEDFENTSGFTIGGGGAQYWGLAPLGGTVSFPSNFSQGTSSQSGTIFYGSFAKQYQGSPAATMTINLPDLSGYKNLKLTVALAAPDVSTWETSHRDSLHIIGSATSTPPFVSCANAGCLPVVGAIDSFLATYNSSPLQSKVYSIDLHPQFQDFEYSIDSSLKAITFAFASTASVEVIGIDSVKITGTPIN
jgi:hypothetical protein